MALTTPILPVRVIPFDKSEENIFTFEVVLGDQVIKNELEIQNNSDNTQVYLETQETFKFEHSVPINTLINGTQYKYRIRTYNINNDFSEWSEWSLFWCFSIPSISITNLFGGVLNNSSWEFLGQYLQAESEELESYKFYLYDINESLIAASSTIYYQDGDTISHTFSGLKDNVMYKVELKTTTLHGMEATSGLQTFSVNYLTPEIPAVVVLENLPNQGKIKATVNIINIVGTSNVDPLAYIDNEWIDLSDDNTWVEFDNGFSCSGNFTLKLWCKGLKNNTIFLELFSDDHTEQLPHKIALKFLNNRVFVDKLVGSQNYHIYSDEITPSESDIVFIWLQGKDNLLSVKTEIVV